MNTYKNFFSLNDTEKIIISFKDPLEYIGWNYSEPILFLYNKKLIILADGPTYFNVRDFRDQLDNVLRNRLPLQKSITKNIGFLYNQYIQNYNLYYKNRTFFVSTGNRRARWSGYQNYVWEASQNEQKYTTWLYNDPNGQILLTITPTYPYSHITKRHIYIPYKKWILKYKPYYTAIISKETAQQWYNQADMIVKAIDENVKRWETEYEKN
jgi:hypothetical protein